MKRRATGWRQHEGALRVGLLRALVRMDREDDLVQSIRRHRARTILKLSATTAPSSATSEPTSSPSALPESTRLVLTA